MKHSNCWITLFLLLAVLGLVACADTSAGTTAEKPAIVEPIEGTELNRLILTEKAAQRLDIQTTQVREEQVEGEKRLIIPYSALIYDLEGKTWMYVNPEPLTYVREPITVDTIEGDTAFLVEGPAPGTEIVTVGVAELYGTDTGIGK